MNAYKAPRTGITKDSFCVLNKVGKTANNLVNNATRDCVQNGKLLGTVDGFSETLCMPAAVTPAQTDQFYNAKDRFRDPYQNKYKGFMFVVDAAIKFHEGDVKFAATAGYSSGDADPNFEQKDGDYRGFIGLQELYSGKRVRSAFYMGGQGKLRRPLDTPTTEEKIDRFAANVSGFTDLAFVGAGITWEPREWEKRFWICSNVLAYWETWPDRKFDALNNVLLPDHARRFLGTEVNIFMEKTFLYSLKAGITASVFLPGSHYHDVRGKPFNKEQQRRIDQLDRTGYELDCIPNLGTDNAFGINIFFEYRF